MEHLLAGLSGLLLKPLCRLYCCDDVVAWDEAQSHQICRDRVAADWNESDDVPQFLLMMEVVAEALEGSKFLDVEEIGGRADLQSIIETVCRLEERKQCIAARRNAVRPVESKEPFGRSANIGQIDIFCHTEPPIQYGRVEAVICDVLARIL